MIFSSSSEFVDKPCDSPLSYPYQCFREKFVTFPSQLFTSSVQLLGLAVVLFAWVLAAALVYYVCKKTYKLSACFFNNTRVGQKIATFVPIHKLCCSSASTNNQNKKFLSTQSIGDYGASIVSKVNDTKWIKTVFRKKPGKDEAADVKTPSKTPQRSTSRLSFGSPRLLSH